MAGFTNWRLVGRGLAAVALRFIVAVAYATGFNAVIFLPLAQVQAQTLPRAPASREQQPPAAGDLAETITSPAISGTSYAPHAGSSYVYYSSSGDISVTPANFARASDINGNVLDYVVSAWVAPAQGQTCSLSMEDASGNSIFAATSASGDASSWYYLEAILPASSSIGSNKPVVQCSNGGAIDDIRYSTAVGGFGAAVYDSSTYYRPQAQLMDDGKVGRSAYDDRNSIIASYVERLDSTDHSVASRMLSNYTVAGYKLFDGWGGPAVQTLSMYYTADTGRNDVEMLAYRSSFLPVGAPNLAAARRNHRITVAASSSRMGCRAAAFPRRTRTAGPVSPMTVPAGSCSPIPIRTMAAHGTGR
jgi:hypothetical protein